MSFYFYTRNQTLICLFCNRFSKQALRLAREGGARVSRVACETFGALLSSPTLLDRPDMSDLRADRERDLVALLNALGPTPDRFLSTLHRLHKYFPRVLELEDSRCALIASSIYVKPISIILQVKFVEEHVYVYNFYIPY